MDRGHNPYRQRTRDRSKATSAERVKADARNWNSATPIGKGFRPGRRKKRPVEYIPQEETEVIEKLDNEDENVLDVVRHEIDVTAE